MPKWHGRGGGVNFTFALHGVYMIISLKTENNAQKIASEQIGREKRKLNPAEVPALRARKGCCGCTLFYRIEHILDEDTVSARRIRYKNMRYGATSFRPVMIGLPLIP